MELVNCSHVLTFISFLVFDATLAIEDALIGLPILKHLVIGRIPIYYGSTKPSHAPFSHQDHARENYLAHKFEKEPFPDPDLMDVYKK